MGQHHVTVLRHLHKWIMLAFCRSDNPRIHVVFCKAVQALVTVHHVSLPVRLYVSLDIRRPVLWNFGGLALV